MFTNTGFLTCRTGLSHGDSVLLAKFFWANITVDPLQRLSLAKTVSYKVCQLNVEITIPVVGKASTIVSSFSIPANMMSLADEPFSRPYRSLVLFSALYQYLSTALGPYSRRAY